MMTEAQLLAALKRAEPHAVKEWYQQYQPQLLAIARKKARTDEDAEELVQETFINCLRNLHAFQGKAALATWMKSILFHEIADYYRKLYAKKAIRTLPLGDLLLAAPIADVHEVSIKVKEVLSKMIVQQRELLMMKYLDKKKVKDIAQQLGKTVKAVESDLFRARQEFRQLYAAAAVEG